MTWNINISGHDNLDSEAKIAYETGLVERARQLAAEVDASDRDKIRALNECVCEATVELATLGVSLDDIERLHEEAYAQAEYELEMTA